AAARKRPVGTLLAARPHGAAAAGGARTTGHGGPAPLPVAAAHRCPADRARGGARRRPLWRPGLQLLGVLDLLGLPSARHGDGLAAGSDPRPGAAAPRRA